MAQTSSSEANQYGPDTGEQISAELYKERATRPDGKIDYPDVKRHPELADDAEVDGYLHGDPEREFLPSKI